MIFSFKSHKFPDDNCEERALATRKVFKNLLVCITEAIFPLKDT